MNATLPEVRGYRILEPLGHGGMGRVFLAQDEALERRVAIKGIAAPLAAEAAVRARFLREARAMAGVEHPNVVRVYAFGEAEGQPYIVMEYVEGETLAARLSRVTRLDVDEALRIAREVAQALAAAWSRGIVHRDVKPANILLDRDDRARVADFGL
ncbi:MAG TPA: serine/threonine-protein kinase, partial [Vicinamibacteria bacterium]|nr:serine/threonine-protein kinase [Vicinamibacteria bacterium]